MCPVVLDLEKIVAYDNVFSNFSQSSQDTLGSVPKVGVIT